MFCIYNWLGSILFSFWINTNWEKKKNIVGAQKHKMVKVTKEES
jgi:hypothetical protein